MDIHRSIKAKGILSNVVAENALVVMHAKYGSCYQGAIIIVHNVNKENSEFKGNKNWCLSQGSQLTDRMKTDEDITIRSLAKLASWPTFTKCQQREFLI